MDSNGVYVGCLPLRDNVGVIVAVRIVPILGVSVKA